MSATSEGMTEGATDASAGSLPNDIPAQWREYCYVTLSKDTPGVPYDVIAEGGASFLAVAPGGQPPLLRNIYLFTDDGPVVQHLSTGPGKEVGVTTNCPDLEATTRLYAVLDDVTLYADPALTEVACEMSAGTTVPSELAEGGSGGYAEVREGGLLITIDHLAVAYLCGGLESGYLFLPGFTYGGLNASAYPFGMILAPA